MKTKNLILGICAFAFAFGSAFASLNTAVDYKIEVTESDAPGCADATYCRDITSQNECNGSSEINCTVEVTSTNMSPNTQDANTRNLNCVILKDSSGEPVTTLSDNCIIAVN